MVQFLLVMFLKYLIPEIMYKFKDFFNLLFSYIFHDFFIYRPKYRDFSPEDYMQIG